MNQTKMTKNSEKAPGRQRSYHEGQNKRKRKCTNVLHDRNERKQTENLKKPIKSLVQKDRLDCIIEINVFALQ